MPHNLSAPQAVEGVAPPSRRLSGGRPRPPRRGRDALGTAGKMPALLFFGAAQAPTGWPWLLYHSTVRRRPSSKFTRTLYPKCFCAFVMSASECLMSPPRSGPYLTAPLYPVSGFKAANVSFSVIRRPVAQLNTRPAHSAAGAEQASRLAETALSM